MARRAFVDSDGTEWQVFDVVPRTEERRTSDRRALAERERKSAASIPRR